jgi:hypothetical protein
MSDDSGYTVRVRYTSGVTEYVEGAAPETACSIFAEAEDNVRVLSAVVTGPTGTTVDEFDHRT